MNDNNHLTLGFPDGHLLIARLEDDPDYPRIAVYLHRVSECDELLCMAEYNPEKAKDQELCIGAYTAGSDDPAYYESYKKTEEV